jgi:hypothetical protein
MKTRENPSEAQKSKKFFQMKTQTKFCWGFFLGKHFQIFEPKFG